MKKFLVRVFCLSIAGIGLYVIGRILGFLIFKISCIEFNWLVVMESMLTLAVMVFVGIVCVVLVVVFLILLDKFERIWRWAWTSEKKEVTQ